MEFNLTKRGPKIFKRVGMLLNLFIMKQLKRLHLSNLKSTEMGELWGGYELPEVVVTPRPTFPPITTTQYVAPADAIKVYTPPIP